jgi:hypothetical protein
MNATLSEETAEIRIEGEVTGQIAIGHHIVQVVADRGILNVAPPQEQIIPRRRAEPAPSLACQTMCSWHLAGGRREP